MMALLDIALLMGIWMFVRLTQRYMNGLVLVFGLLIADVFRFGMSNSLMLCGGMLLMLWMIIKDTQARKEESIVLKHNPLHEGNAISKRLRLVVLAVILMAFAVRVVSFLINLCGRNWY